ncbi:MAG: helix-turn-helix domain-containing protein [Demequina sp.]|uniref:helix-turn-helix domain-containing protein n=1 Tax=Demequina sp. TaxID=2050685 RepID=UPI003A89DA91
MTYSGSNTDKPDFNHWHRRIGTHLGRLRDARGLSAQQVADRTRGLGVEITRSSIANLESGRKTSLSVVELAVLAAALDVAPVRLLFDVEDDPVEVLPGNRVHGIDAADWFSGLASLPGSTSSEDIAGPLALFRRHKEIRQKLTALNEADEPNNSRTSDLLHAWTTALLATRSEMTACNVTPPVLDTKTQRWLSYAKPDA